MYMPLQSIGKGNLPSKHFARVALDTFIRCIDDRRAAGDRVEPDPVQCQVAIGDEPLDPIDFARLLAALQNGCEYSQILFAFRILTETHRDGRIIDFHFSSTDGIHSWRSSIIVNGSRDQAKWDAFMQDLEKRVQANLGAGQSLTASVIILTALPVECLAVLKHLCDVQEEVLTTGTIVEVGKLITASTTIQVGVVEVGPGNNTAAAMAQEVISHFTPSAAVFIGVAGGIKDVKIGDVVAATKVYGFESGKAGDEFQPRPDVASCSHRLVQRARADARKVQWRDRLSSDSTSRESVNVRIGPIAAGSQVVSSTRSPIYSFITSNYSDAIAVEMEGRGFLEAASHNGLDALVVRGISDLIDKKSEADARGSQNLAAENAAAFAFEVIANLFSRQRSVNA